MKLLIVTQRVDSSDPILGFFHRWIEEFATHAESVTVICQSKGSHALPDNADVLSLQKEQGASKLSQIISFWKVILRERKKYDRVFVHMTPIWILLGAPVWLLLRKPMYLWYEIKRGSLKLTLALLFVKNVFAASPHGLPSVSRKQVTIGHGIDLDAFTVDTEKRERNHIVAVGRVTQVKRYDVILRALSNLPDCRLTIAGGTVTESDKQTEKDLQALMHRFGIADRVEMGWVSPEEVPHLMQRADVMMHASEGGLDKVVLQAMACGCPVVSCSEAAASILPKALTATASSLAETVQGILALDEDVRNDFAILLRSIVEKDHSLAQCIERISTHMQ